MASPRELADRFHSDWLEVHPFDAANYGIPGYDDRVPDASEAGEAAWRDRVVELLGEANAIDTSKLSEADRTTLGCLVIEVEQEIAMVDSKSVEHTVTPMPFSGPAWLLAVVARSVIADSKAAGDYLERLQKSGRWIDQVSERLRTGAQKGRLPVAPLVEQTIAWAVSALSADVPAALTAPIPPEDWDGAPQWRQERDRIGRDVVKPAIGRWVDLLREILPSARSASEPGLTYLPGGEADYARAIWSHTTLPLTAIQLHQTGLDQIAELEARVIELGGEIGLSSLAEVHEALRASCTKQSAAEAIEAASSAIRRAEARAKEVFPEPLPPACAVTPMPQIVASSGMAPHYTPPRLDGSRPGTFWFNTERPTAGTGWDLEAVAFHEAVPGHHLQLSRVQLLTDLPALQRQRSVTVFSEGWGLYAEQLAGEIGLYSGTEGALGALAASLMRAARLVIDTGLHALGWSRQEAVDFYVAHVPMPVDFLANEVDRYIIWPGQALAYLTGKLEILRLRDEARRALGGEFALPDFHGALLDSGSLPMPVLEEKIRFWIASSERKP
ncbi:MAG TPA: DUF885 domain-containing protein [Acidimicrobiales bacterium]|nr:DUF885 domain-containing protein [Acidimicrobiales bacterium]